MEDGRPGEEVVRVAGKNKKGGNTNPCYTTYSCYSSIHVITLFHVNTNSC